MLDFCVDTAFCLSVLQIIVVNILLSGDNAVVIALACRRLPEHQRNKGIFWGIFGAIALRIVLVFFAVKLMGLPFLQICGAGLLLWIGIKLLQTEEEEDHSKLHASTTLFGAVRTVIVADVVMSLDNVIAVAGAAKGHMALVTFGIIISIPLIVCGSKFVLMLMDRFPVVILLGGGLLGWIGGEMALSDVVVKPYLSGAPHWMHYSSAAMGAVVVMIVGKWLGSRKALEPV